MTIDEMIGILNVIKAGNKQVEKSLFGTGTWLPFNPVRDKFDPISFDYRVKPEPRHVWLRTLRDGTPTAGMILTSAPEDGADGVWIHFIEVTP